VVSLPMQRREGPNTHSEQGKSGSSWVVMMHAICGFCSLFSLRGKATNSRMNQISRCEISLISFRLRYWSGVHPKLCADVVAVVTHASSSTHGIGCFSRLQQTFGHSRTPEHQNIAHSFLHSTSTPSLLFFRTNCVDIGD
jgi:hypothetical protein